MKFTAVGDVLIQRRIQKGFGGYGELRPYIEKGDARFFNLETTLNREGECFASQFSGGTYLRTNPEVLEDIKAFGFNLTSINNNHIMDFSYEGMAKTIEAVEKSGLVHGGVGSNLTQASSPVYLETENGRVALISVNSSFDPSMAAGEQSRRVKGRPGINSLHVEETVVVTKEQFEALKALAKATGINAELELRIKQGYSLPLPENILIIGSTRFKLGEKPTVETSVSKDDMARVERAIFEAKPFADYIMVSIHTHQVQGESNTTPPQFTVEFAHKCIDAGANAVIGHGPHELRPIEIYKNKPIFYSLGDFVLQLYNVELAPEDFYKKYGLNSNASICELLKTRSKNFTIGLMEDEVMLQTVIPYWETENGDLTHLELLPIEIIKNGNNSEIGLPRITKNPAFMERLIKMSADFGTDIKMKNGIGLCELN